jgi:hypothetical protein
VYVSCFSLCVSVRVSVRVCVCVCVCACGWRTKRSPLSQYLNPGVGWSATWANGVGEQRSLEGVFYAGNKVQMEGWQTV